MGVLVDDATVAIENITHHREKGKSLQDAILNGSGEIALPTLVSTLCICIVFVPMFLLTRRRALSVRAARGGGGVCDDGLLLPVAHADSHAGPLPVARRARRAARRAVTQSRGDMRHAGSARVHATLRDRLRSGCGPDTVDC